MRIYTALFVVSAGLIASAQTTVQDSRNVPQTPAASTTYVLTPPNVALPGSGVATGQPLRNDVNVNDARNPQGGAVFQPATVGGTPMVETYRISTPEMSAEGTPSQASSSTTEPVTGEGMRSFSTGAPGSLANDKSLADIATEQRGNKPGIGKRSFDNSDISALRNSVGNQPTELPQSDAVTGNDEGGYSTPSGESVLNRSDYDAVQAALARHAETQTAAQGDEVAVAQNQMPQSDSQAGANDVDRKTVEQAKPEENPSSETEATAQTLPQTSSALPLLGLLGAGAVTFGMVFRNARRNF